MEIESKTEINRSETAALATVLFFDNPEQSELFNVYFQTPGQFQPGEASLTLSDVPDSHWANDAIHKAVDLGILERDADNLFRPEQPLTKLEFVYMLQEFLINIVKEPDLGSRYFGSGESFSDLNSSHWAYNAARLALDYGLAQLLGPGVFGINENVSAIDVIEALESLRKIQ